jgi:Uncharacterized protein conserved in bacteria (DUF2312)
VLREAIRIRKKDQKERDEEELLLDVYLQALATALPPIAKAGDQSSQGVWAALSFVHPARNSGLPILLAFARRKLLGRANVWLESASHRQLGDISLTAPGQMP